MNLRSYQSDAVDSTMEHLQRVPATLVVMPTGTGKTVFFAHTIQRFAALGRGRAMVIAHREELLDQARDKIEAVTGIRPDLEMADSRATEGFLKSPIVVSSVQTQTAGRTEKRYSRFNPKEFGLLIIDECFPAGTLIDGRPIEMLRPGDTCVSRSESGNIEEATIVEIYKRPSLNLIRVTFDDSSVLICTPTHPIYSATKGTFVLAIALDEDDVVLTITEYERDLHELRQRILMQEVPPGHVLGKMSSRTFLANDVEHESEVCVEANDGTESDATGGDTGKGVDQTTRDGMDAANARRQWQGADATAASPGVRTRLGNGIGRAYGSSEKQSNVPDVLQAGYRMPPFEGRDRDRRPQSRLSFTSRPRPEKTVVLGSKRVANIEVFQPSRHGTFDGLCPDGFVYNLRVEPNNTYFADGVLVHNCHHAPADTYREVIKHYQQNPLLKVLGVTATPDRHDGEALGQIFDSVAFDYEITDAIAEGWLVNVSQKYLSVEVDFGGVPIVLGDFQGKALRELLAQGQTLEKIASDSINWSGRRKTLVFSDSVQNAETLCECFNRYALGSARIVSGETPRDERRQLIADYREGRFQFLTNVGVATEGFDVPDIACVVMARPTCSRALYAQMLGRGTRPLTGLVDGFTDAELRCLTIRKSEKPDVLILDIVGNSAKHKLITAGDILGGKYSDREIEEAEALLRGSDKPADVAAALEEARRRLNAEILAEAQRQEALKLKTKSRARDIDPFGVFGVMRRTLGTQSPLDPEQKAKLERWGIDGLDNLDWTAAQQLIDEFRSRTRRGLATYRQVKNLVRNWGMTEDEARRTSYEEAGRIMTILANNRWRKPVGVK